MCIGDWRLGRLVRIKSVTFDPTGPRPTFTANKQRVGIMFTGEVSTPLTQFVVLQLGSSNFLTFDPSSCGPVLFTLEKHGELPTLEWTVNGNSTVDTVSVTEFFLPENVLSAGIEEFYSKYPKAR